MEVEQDEEFSRKFAAKDNAEKIKLASYDRAKRLATKCDDDERSQLRRIMVLLAWGARQNDQRNVTVCHVYRVW